MLLCGFFLAVMAILWITGRRKLSKTHRQMAGVVMVAALAGLLYGSGNVDGNVLSEGHLLERKENGGGAYEQALELEIEGYESNLEYKVRVPEQRLTKEEESAYLQAAAEELQQDFLGENESVNCIRKNVSISDSYQEGRVLASWSFDNYKIVNSEGEIVAEEIAEEGELIKAKVVLSCEDTERTEEFYFRVFPVIRDTTEEIFWQIGQMIKVQSEEEKTFIELPQVVTGYPLVWTVQKERTPEKILLFGLVIAIFVPLLAQSRQQELKKNRLRLLELEYPDMVSKIALLLGAGMTLQGAIRRIVLNYNKKRELHQAEEMPVYEELQITCREIENGMGEGAAYERFGIRCGIPEYRKLGNLLAQNLKKGNSGIMALLEEEAGCAFEKRKEAARRYGEEAGTKLLLPMMLMLGLVMVVLLVPAVLTFQ